MNETLTIEPLVDRDELAKILGVNVWTISAMRRRREIPTHQIRPRIFRYRVSEVLAKLKGKEGEAR